MEIGAGSAAKPPARQRSKVPLRVWLQRILLGMPSRPFTSGRSEYAGATQTRWGGWWDRHPRLIRLLALAAIAWMTVYLVWRVGWSSEGASPWLWAMLLFAEGYGLWNLAMLAWFSWTVHDSKRPPATPGHQVDVYVCTYDEPAAVLRETLAGCAALTYPHTTYLLDDGRRPEMARLARQWGAEYLTRPDNSHAKAGNINHALPKTQGDLVFLLDADHVPLPDALDAVVGYFDDSKVALVQTPHDFYNHDSIQHYEVGRHEQSVFYSVVSPGKDRHGAAFWCGSAAVIRRAALLQIGGVATETIAEDFHTTIKLQRAGWASRYHDEVVVQGLAPHDLAAYLLQRDRWARGNLAVFASPESPLRARELTPLQRLSYFASLSSYLAGPVRLLTLAVLAAVLWTGQLPLTPSLLTLALLWAPATMLMICAGSALCRGYQSVADTTHFELCTAEIFTRALRCSFFPGRTTFKVTPKEGIDLGGFAAIRQLRAVTAIAVLLGAGILVRILDETAIDVVPDLAGLALWVVPIIGVVELRRVLRTLALVARRRQLRTEYRMPIEAPVVLALPKGTTPMIGTVRDISPAGIGLELPAPVPEHALAGATIAIPTIAGDTEQIRLELQIESCRPRGDGWFGGATIAGASAQHHRRLVEYCYVVNSWNRLRETVPVALPEPAPITPLPVGDALPSGRELAAAG